MTAQELFERLLEMSPAERRHVEVRVVFHGREERSFNRPALGTSGPNIGVSFNVVCEEPR